MPSQVIEALMTEECFDSSHQLWHDCVELSRDQSTLHKETFRYLAMIPGLRKKAKLALSEGRDSHPTIWETTFLEIQVVAQNYQPIYETMLEQLEARIILTTSGTNDRKIPSFSDDETALRILRFVFPACMTQLLLHAWLSFYDPLAQTKMKQAAQCVCGYVPLGMLFRPLGAAFMTFPLRMAYIGVTSDAQRAWVKDQVNTIHQDIQGPRAHLVTFKELDWWADTISLKCLSPTGMPWTIAARDPVNCKPEAMKTWAEAREARMGPSDEILADDTSAGPAREYRDYNDFADAIEWRALDD